MRHLASLCVRRISPKLPSWTLLLVLALATSSIARAEIPHAITKQGEISGVSENGLAVYKGVPFASPPVGDLRWRPPVRPASWKGVLAADAFAPACMQTGVSMPGELPTKVSENCLYLNIWTPANSAGKRLPVIVWIYGGGFANGSASMPLYWGDRLAHKGVIVVTIAYRVGPLGFLAHPALTRESPRHTSGNYGLMDQIAALEWVQSNIAVFGGNPKNVTIAGQSAGSMCVSILMASPRAKGFFQRAIGESGGLFEPLQLAPRFFLANAEHDGEQFASSLGATSIEQLRQLPAEKLSGGNTGNISHPVIEPYVLPLTPYEVFSSGTQNAVPVLVGSNTEEARAMVDPSHVKAASFEADIKQQYSWLPTQILAAYPHRTDEEAQESRIALETDIRFGWDMWTWARLQAETGHSPVYYYSFRQHPPFPTGSVYEGWGASHFAELWYVFDHLDQSPWKWTPSDRRLADQMSGYWVNFAKTGDPNGPNLPRWPRFSNDDSKVLHLGDPIVVGGVADLNGLSAIDAGYKAARKSHTVQP